MIKFRGSIVIFLIASMFLITTCTTENSIIGSDQTLSKTTSVVDINSPVSEDDEYDWWDAFIDLFGVNTNMEAACFWIVFIRPPRPPILQQSHVDDLSKQYDFRDNFLLKSDKGKAYTASYYILSKYGIENNLVNKYYKEHYELLKSSMEVAYDLQYGSNNNRIIINKNIVDDLKDMLKVYRSSPNHKEIEPVLDYLEADLEKYYDKPKYKIAADFEQD